MVMRRGCRLPSSGQREARRRLREAAEKGFFFCERATAEGERCPLLRSEDFSFFFKIIRVFQYNPTRLKPNSG